MVSYKMLALSAVGVPAALATLFVGKSLATSVTGLETPAGVALIARLVTARDGEVIRLDNKDYGVVTFPPRAHARPIVLEAGAARFSGLVIRGTSGVTVNGGTITGPGGKSYGISINGSSAVTIAGMTITGAHRGIVINKSDTVVLQSNTLTGLLSDGIDIALSRRVTVRDNSCSNFTPTMQAFDSTGKPLTSGGDHPDCIQAWSRPSDPPTSDIVVEGNRIDGHMQGIFFGNHVRAGVDDGGFDRVVIRNNVVRISLYHGVTLGNARDSMITGNSVATIPGAVNARKPGTPVRAWLRVTGDRNTVCGNKVADFPRDPATLPCAKVAKR